MSTGQIIGGVVGAVASFFVPGASMLVYASIGSAIGGALVPPKGPTLKGPRLEDLTVQTSTYGAVIPRAYGNVRINGNILWLENNALKETVTKKKSGGKGGGGSSTTKNYTYSATFAVGLCRGPIAGVKRIWVGPNLIYDAGSTDPETIEASNAAAEGFSVYTGTDTQTPDARMQATLGAANTPAWRGLAYIVFYDFQLEKYGNSLVGAQVKVEVMQLGATYDYPVTSRTMSNNRSWIATAWNGSFFCSVATGSNKCATSPDGATWTEHDLPISDNWGDIATNGDIFVIICPYSVYTSEDCITWTLQSLPGMGYPTRVVWGNDKFIIVTDIAAWWTSPTGFVWTSQVAPGTGLGIGSGSYARSLAWNGDLWIAITHFGANQTVLTSPSGYAGTWTSRGTLVGNNYNEIAINNNTGVACVASGNGTGVYVSADGITWAHYTLAKNINSIASDGYVFLATDQTNYYISADGATWTTQAMPFTGTTWRGIVWNGSVFLVTSNNQRAATIQRYFAGSVPSPLDDIVSLECTQSGLLTGADIDVSQLSAINVRGYLVGSVGSIRSAIEPLQSSWPFDIVQHGYTLRFVVRGGTSVATIQSEDLDARISGNDDGVQITTSREMDSQLPRRLTVKYMDCDREYDIGTQYAERLNTPAMNETILDFPIVLTSTEAAGKAEVLLYLYWLERYDVAISLPPTYLQLEPSDVVTLETPEGDISLRLNTVTYTSDGVVECKAKHANAAVYTPTAVGVEPAVTGTPTISVQGGSRCVLMDIPTVHTDQTYAVGFIAAMCGVFPSGWAGGSLMTSTDGGASWSTAGSFSAPGATIGYATNAIGDVDEQTIDCASLLQVELYNGELFSITESAMLSGGNYFAYGADGRWEIIAAQNCVLQVDGSYWLTNLLRGRNGTEWTMGLHSIGDTLVLLDPDDIQLITLSASAISQTRLYRAITEGRDISTDSDRSFAYQGVNLKPLSARGGGLARNTATDDLTLYAYRRSRIVDEWRDYVDIDLGESVESYEWDVCTDNTYSTVLRTLSATGINNVFYSAAEQISDFGATQSTLSFVIYQMSSTVGRGYPTYRTYYR
jgi:hypothetical protein